MAGMFNRRASGTPIRAWDRIRSHVPSAPAAPRRTHVASGAPRGAGADVDDVVVRLRPVDPEQVLVLADAAPATRHSLRSHRSSRRRVRRVTAAITTAVAMTLGATGAMPAAALVVTPGTIPGDAFEQDGNFTPDGAGKIDWTSSASVQAIVVEDKLIASGGGLWDSAFQGSSKEEEPGAWVCQGKEGGVTPGKDNLLRAYVSTRFAATTAYLDLGLVKAEGEGDTHVNIEFNKNGQIVPEALNGPCGVTRSHGDFLVAYDFGGTSTLEAEVRLFTWDATNTEWDEVTTGFTAKAANNTVDIADDPMVPGTQRVEARTFAEATIKLPDGFLTCPGFGTTNIRSRSSHSITSALQDKMPTTGVDLSTCGAVELKKLDDKGNALPGAVFGLFATVAATGTPIATCTSGADGVCRISDVTPGDYFVKEIAAPAGYTPDPDVVPVTVTFRSTTKITVPFVDPLILGSLLIRKTHALGGAVAGVRFFLVQNGQPALKRDGTPAECTTVANGTCTITGLVPGTYTVREDPTTIPATMTQAPDQVVTIVGNQTAEVSFVNPVKPIAIDLVKTVNDKKSVTAHKGDALTYRLSITNTGQVPLTLTALADAANGTPVALPDGCTGLVGDLLAVGASTSCTYPASASADVTNIANVVGTDVFGRTASDQDNAAVDVINPAITLTKLVNDEESVTAHAGEALSYSISFTNTGDTPLTITSLKDVAGGAEVDLPAGCDALVSSVPLPVGGSRSCTYTSSAPAGGISNTATVVGVDSLGGAKGTVTANDTAVVKVIDPSISIVKTVNGEESVTVHAGDALTYELTFTNNGDTPLTVTSLTDVANGVDVDLPASCDSLVNSTPLAAGASRSCTYEAVAGTGDVDNTARVAGHDALGKQVSATDTASVDVIHPAITIVKKVNGQDAVKAHQGDALTYSLLITNTGDTALTITTLTDVAGGAPVTLSTECNALVGTSLAANGGSASCSYPGTAPANDLTNTATVVGVDALGGDKGTVTASDDAFVDVIKPLVLLTKKVNGQDAVTVHEGDALTYMITVKNTGDTPLTITSLGDVANGTTLDLPAACDAIVSATPLVPTETRTCTYTATATPTDVHNVASVTGRDELGGPKGTVTSSDDADVTVISPKVTIVKTVNGQDAVTVHEGDALTYRLAITNSGDTPLTLTSLTDVANSATNVALPSGCTTLVGQTLAVGQMVECTYSTVATAADVHNVATVVGRDELGKSVTDDDDARVDVINPEITIVKTVNGQDFVKVHAGDALTYKLVITNTGDTALEITSLVDVANSTAVTLPASCTGLVGDTLVVDQSVECTYVTTATAADVTNVASVTGEDGLGKEVDDDDDAKVDVLNPAVSIVKTVNGTDSVTVHAGDPLTYRLVIANAGDTPLTITSLTDVANGTGVVLPASCTSIVGTTLAIRASVECSYSTTATSADVTNVATVEGTDELGKKVTDDDPAAVDVINPAITIVKTVNGSDAVTVHAGDTLTYELVITNTGDTALTLSELGDVSNGTSVGLPEDCTALVGTTLAVDASVTCTYTAVAGASDVTNIASVEGTDELGKKVDDDDDAKVDVINPAIRIVKTVNGQDSVKVHAGDQLTYKLVITNTGDTALTLSTLDDVANNAAVALPSECTSLVGTVLAVDASVECTYTEIASTADVTNVATTSGTDELGKKVTDDDDAKVDVINPAIQIVKTANPTEIQGSSGTATFTFVVTNTGDTPLLNVVVTDDILGEIGRIARLEVGASQTLTKTAPVSEAAPVNVGTATGEDELGKKVTDDDDARITFVRGVVVERPAPPAPAPAPLPRTGADLEVQVAIGLMLIVIGGMAVVPNRRRTILGSA